MKRQVKMSQEEAALHLCAAIRARIFLMVGTVSIVGTVYMTARVDI